MHFKVGQASCLPFRKHRHICGEPSLPVKKERGESLRKGQFGMVEPPLPGPLLRLRPEERESERPMKPPVVHGFYKAASSLPRGCLVFRCQRAKKTPDGLCHPGFREMLSGSDQGSGCTV